VFITIETQEKKYMLNALDISYIEPVQTAVFTGVRVFMRTKKPGSDYPITFEAKGTLEEITEQLEIAADRHRFG